MSLKDFEKGTPKHHFNRPIEKWTDRMFKEVKWRDAHMVHEIVVRKMVLALDKCEEDGLLVNWHQFRDYCLEYFNLPVVTIEKAIAEARKRTKYK